MTDEKAETKPTEPQKVVEPKEEAKKDPLPMLTDPNYLAIFIASLG